MLLALTAKNFIDAVCCSASDYRGPCDEEIFEAILWEEGRDSLRNVLYIADKESPAGFDDTCCLFAEKGKLNETLCIARGIIRDDYIRQTALSSLYKAISAGTTTDQILRICQQVMGNPVWLLDERFQPVAFSADWWNAPSVSINRIKSYSSKSDYKIVELVPDETCPYPVLQRPIQYMGKILGYMIVFCLNMRHDRELEKEYFEKLCSILSNQPQFREINNKATQMERFVLNLIQRKVSDPLVINQMMRNLKWETREKYYLLAIDAGATRLSVPVKNTLKSILSHEIYEYEHYYISILGQNMDFNVSAQDFPELIKFLDKFDLYAGLSNAFRNVSMLGTAFDQCATIIPLRKRFSKERLARYEDLILIHLLDIANENGNSVLSFCHPIVAWMKEYDAEHETEYLKTLTAYVLNELNLQRTADVLFIHRNTLYHRICNIKELFKIDFDNPRLVFKLRISVTIYLYLENRPTIDLFGPLI